MVASVTFQRSLITIYCHGHAYHAYLRNIVKQIHPGNPINVASVIFAVANPPEKSKDDSSLPKAIGQLSREYQTCPVKTNSSKCWLLKQTVTAVCLCMAELVRVMLASHSSTNTRHSNNVGLMLGHRRRRWPNIKPALFKCLVFSGILTSLIILIHSSIRL